MTVFASEENAPLVCMELLLAQARKSMNKIYFERNASAVVVFASKLNTHWASITQHNCSGHSIADEPGFLHDKQNGSDL